MENEDTVILQPAGEGLFCHLCEKCGVTVFLSLLLVSRERRTKAPSAGAGEIPADLGSVLVNGAPVLLVQIDTGPIVLFFQDVSQVGTGIRVPVALSACQIAETPGLVTTGFVFIFGDVHFPLTAAHPLTELEDFEAVSMESEFSLLSNEFKIGLPVQKTISFLKPFPAWIL